MKAGSWLRMRYLWALAIPNAMFAMYIVIFCRIRRKRRGIMNSGNETNTVNISRCEWSMLIQAAWNCGIKQSRDIIKHLYKQFHVTFGQARQNNAISDRRRTAMW
uniref:Secreted protein n=1 Tax=Elaeophora elaphi TaxID=1147741 RepID=A0A0R3S784_9BILA